MTRWNGYDQDAAIRLYRCGHTHEQIAVAMGRSESFIAQKQRDVPPPDPEGWPPVSS
jgi:hypothetical protein